MNPISSTIPNTPVPPGKRKFLVYDVTSTQAKELWTCFCLIFVNGTATFENRKNQILMQLRHASIEQIVPDGIIIYGYEGIGRDQNGFPLARFRRLFLVFA